MSGEREETRKMNPFSLDFNSFHEKLFGSSKVSGDRTPAVIQDKRKGNKILDAQLNSDLYNRNISTEKKSENTTGSLGPGWFNLKPLEVDDALKRDLQIIQMRNYLDPKRFYKNPDKIGPIVHVGTVIEGAHEYKSSRLTNRERKGSILDEILSDQAARKYSKRVFADIQKTKQTKLKFGRFDKKQKRKKLRAFF